MIWLLLATGVTGAILLPRWCRAQGGPEPAVYLHGGSAALALILAFLSFDNTSAADGRLLLFVFLSIATGVLLFLQRQRLKRFSRLSLGLHGLFALLAVALAAGAIPA